MKTPRYITTTLPYVNAEPHIGFALELVQADALARFWRLQGDDVFFNTGTDEHGQKIFEAAEKAGEDVQAYVDRHADSVARLRESLDLSYDAFARTTSEAHVAAAQELWRRCAERGDIELREYEGLYCVGHEAFITEKELEDGKCPEHDRAPELLREKNYFFKFKNYESYLLEYLERPDAVVPEWRRQEAITFVQNGLEDFSISRERERLSWGIPVPGDDSQVMYVWFDALSNYISTLGWPEDESGNFEKFWTNGHTLQMAGKDQVRFQSLMWQAMLRSAGIEKGTDQIFYHGFVTSGGKKMSKTLGNVISPFDLVERYGTDATRYLLLRHVHPTDDTDVTWEKLDEWYTANLVNGLGNLVARVMKLAETHLEASIERPEADPFPAQYVETLDAFEFNEAADVVWKKIQDLDERITSDEPFKVIKDDVERGRKIIAECAEELYRIGRLLNPLMPATSDVVKGAVLENKKPENLFPRLS